MQSVHAGGRGEARDSECIETGIRPRHGSARREFSGVRRTRQTPTAPMRVAFQAALVVQMANLSLKHGCDGSRSLPAIEPDSPPGILMVFPSHLIIWNGPRRQGFATPRNNGAPLTAPG